MFTNESIFQFFQFVKNSFILLFYENKFDAPDWFITFSEVFLFIFFLAITVIAMIAFLFSMRRLHNRLRYTYSETKTSRAKITDKKHESYTHTSHAYAGNGMFSMPIVTHIESYYVSMKLLDESNHNSSIVKDCETLFKLAKVGDEITIKYVIRKDKLTKKESLVLIDFNF